jgi:arylsulfatase
MIVRWPNKIPAGSRNNFVWTFYDVMPTLADFANSKIPEITDGISVMPTILGEFQVGKPFHYWEFYSPFQQAVRMGNWKGYRTGTSEPIQLFDINTDLLEKNDLSSQNPEIVKKIEKIMSEEHTTSEFWPTIEFENK